MDYFDSYVTRSYSKNNDDSMSKGNLAKHFDKGLNLTTQK